MPETARRKLVVVNGRVLLQPCTLYKSHACAVLNGHHVAPLSWWQAAGVAVDTPIVTICPACHANCHAAIDSIIAGRDVSALPPRCVALARRGLEIAQAHGLTPAPTL